MLWDDTFHNHEKSRAIILLSSSWLLIGLALYLVHIRAKPEAIVTSKALRRNHYGPSRGFAINRLDNFVRPRTQTDLLAEVPGIIEAVAPFPMSKILQPFRAGGFLERRSL